MDIYGWLITIIPILVVVGVAVYARRYVRDVSEYIAAGRVAGRYVIAVGDLEASLSVVGFITMMQQYYNCGFAIGFWDKIVWPVSVILGITAFATYRYRETKALSLGQLVEMRYNRTLRIFASVIRITAEVLANSIGPAVTARFFIYFIGLNQYVTIFGCRIETFVLIITVVVLLCLVIVLAGGQVSLLVTDCLQGLMGYPIFLIFTVFIIANFSWTADFIPVLSDRVPGESFLNPYDVHELRDFNLFLLFVTFLQMILYRANWLFGANTAARTAHEGRMGGLLGTWRSGYAYLSITLIAITVIAFMNGPKYAEASRDVRRELGSKLARDVIENKADCARVVKAVESAPVEVHQFSASPADIQNKFSHTNNPDEHFLSRVRTALCPAGSSDANKTIYAKYRSLYTQLLCPAALRKIFPPALMGLFTLLMFMLMLSTDDSRLFNSAIAIVQDLIVPLKKTPFTNRQQLMALRISAVFVGILFVIGSLYLSQLEYLKMFCMFITSFYTSGAAPAMLLGLYWKRGTTAAAFTSFIAGGITSVAGILIRNNWGAAVYPWLAEHGWVDAVGSALTTVSRPFNPIIVWKMNAFACPINAVEMIFISMVISWSLYIVVSLLTCKQPFNMDRMLHRGIYNDDPNKKLKRVWNWRTVWSNLIGITPEYTRGDRVLAWSCVIYSLGWGFVVMFIGVNVANAISPWGVNGWSNYHYLTRICLPLVIGSVTTVWFLIGGIRGLADLFRRLEARKTNELDNGVVDDKGVSLADDAAFAEAEKNAEAGKK